MFPVPTDHSLRDECCATKRKCILAEQSIEESDDAGRTGARLAGRRQASTPDTEADVIRRMTLRSLLSFGPDTPEAKLGPLNVRISPNGPGRWGDA